MTCGPLRKQSVPDAPDGLDRVGVERYVDFAPQVADVDLDDVVGTVEVGIPDARDDFRLGNDRVLLHHQMLEYRKLAWCQGDWGAIAFHQPARWVQCQGARGQYSGSLGRTAPDERSYTREENAEPEWFGEIVIC